MLDLHREITWNVNSGILQKVQEDTTSKVEPTCHRVGAAALPAGPMRFNLADPASTDFED
jgi:hypothetical protein